MNKSRVTMADVAELAQVSKMSVSRVLNNKPGVAEETKQRIFDAVQQLGYTLDAGYRPNATEHPTIALLVPDITSNYMGEIIQGVSNASELLNYGVMLYTKGVVENMRKSDYYMSLLSKHLVQGVLIIIPHGYESIAADLENYHLPYVVIDHHNGTGNEPSVTATNRKGTLDATRHLLALGHTRIGFITGRMEIKCSHDRLQGYRDGLAEVELPYDPELVVNGDFHPPSGYDQTQKLLQLSNPPTAIIASNDSMAFGAMDAAKTCGMTIGSDISIIGFDDIRMASQTHPSLTTVRQPLTEMGEVALDMLVNLIQGHRLLTPQRILPTELIVRESTGRAPHLSK